MEQDKTTNRRQQWYGAESKTTLFQSKMLHHNMLQVALRPPEEREIQELITGILLNNKQVATAAD